MLAQFLCRIPLTQKSAELLQLRLYLCLAMISSEMGDCPYSPQILLEYLYSVETGLVYLSFCFGAIESRFSTD